MKTRATIALLVLFILFQCSITVAETKEEDKSQDDKQFSSLFTSSTSVSSIDYSKIKSSLNHRSDAFNPTSPRFNPTTQQSIGGKTSVSSHNRAAKNHQALNSQKSSSFVKNTASNAAFGAVLSVIVHADKLKDGEITDFATEVGKDVVCSVIPGAHEARTVYNVHHECTNGNHCEEAVVGAAKGFATTVAIGYASAFCGPFAGVCFVGGTLLRTLF